jgi:hypothetical protein
MNTNVSEGVLEKLYSLIHKIRRTRVEKGPGWNAR